MAPSGDVLPSGRYMIRSVELSTYAILKDDKDPSTVRSEVFALDKAKSQVCPYLAFLVSL